MSESRGKSCHCFFYVWVHIISSLILSILNTSIGKYHCCSCPSVFNILTSRKASTVAVQRSLFLSSSKITSSVPRSLNWLVIMWFRDICLSFQRTAFAKLTFLIYLLPSHMPGLYLI